MLSNIVQMSPYLPQIVERLRRIQPERVILFGSYAYGTPHKDSDIDLIVILNTSGIARTYREKAQTRMSVAKELLEIEHEVPLDTLVYTRDEWNMLLANDSAFARLIQQKGVVLYEAQHPGMDESSQR